MFALIAAVVLLFSLLGVGVGAVNMIALGLFFLTLHFVVDVGLPWRR